MKSKEEKQQQQGVALWMTSRQTEIILTTSQISPPKSEYIE